MRMNWHYRDKLFWMIARGIDEYDPRGNYIDERLAHRVNNLHLGLNLLGRAPVGRNGETTLEHNENEEA